MNLHLYLIVKTKYMIKRKIALIMVIIMMTLLCGCSDDDLTESEMKELMEYFNSTDSTDSSQKEEHEISYDMLLSYVNSEELEEEDNKIERTEDETSVDKKNYTVMIYMVGSDLESDYNCASLDLQEIMASGVDTSDCNVVVYTGGCSRWLLNIPSGKNSILELTDSSFYITGGTEESENMGDPETFADFLSYCYSTYPADNYALICWDHGGGPIYGYGGDELFEYDSLSLEEMYTALDNSPFKEDKLEWIGFDACLMGSIETAEVWQNYAEYMIGSEESEPAYGWDYSFLSTINSTEDTLEIAESIIKSYGAYYEENSTSTYNPDYTLSCVDLSHASDVILAMNELTADMNEDISGSNATEIVLARNKTKEFGLSDSSRFYLVDLDDMAAQLSDLYPEKTEELQGTIEDYVKLETSNTSKSCGVSMYYPIDNGEYSRSKSAADSASAYGDFLFSFSDSQISGTISSEGVEVNDNGDTVQISIPEEKLETLSNVTYCIFWEVTDDFYIPVLSNVEAEVSSDGTIEIEKDQSLFFLETDSETGYIPWMVKQTLNNAGEEKYITQKTGLCGAYPYFSWDGSGYQTHLSIQFKNEKESDDVIIQNIIDESSETEVTGKSNVSVEDCSMVYYSTNGFVPTEDESGEMLPYTEWEETEYTCFVTCDLDNTFSFAKKSTTETSYEYYCQAIFTNANGETYATDIFALDNGDEEEIIYETENGEMSFVIQDDYAILNWYKGTDSVVEIPSEVSGIPVKALGGCAFESCSDVTKIIVPDTVESIYGSCFLDCTSLTEISLGSEIKHIGKYAFANCSSLTKLILPLEVETIGEGILAYCTSLEELSFGDEDVSEIKSASNENYVIKDGVLFNKDMSELISYTYIAGKNYTIPYGVKSISASAFAGMSELKSVNISDSVTDIGNFAFYSCLCLDVPELSDNIESIGMYAFGMSVLDLTFSDESDAEDAPESGTLYIGTNVSEIGTNAFSLPQITGFEVSEDNGIYSSYEGSLCNKYGDTVLYEATE